MQYSQCLYHWCAAVFSAEVVSRNLCTSHCQTRQPVDADWKVPCLLQASADATTAEENRTWHLIASELQTDFQSNNRLQGHQETCADLSATTTARFYQLQRVPFCFCESTVNDTVVLFYSILNWIRILWYIVPGIFRCFCGNYWLKLIVGWWRRSWAGTHRFMWIRSTGTRENSAKESQ